jgi:hypothetical protein
MLAAGVILAMLATSPLDAMLPRVSVESECGRVLLHTPSGVFPLQGAAPGLCVREALLARLEKDATHVVLKVAREDERGGKLRDRLFVYRLEGHRLWPRFLGSGPKERQLASVQVVRGSATDSLSVRLEDAQGREQRLRCRLEAFPLVCIEEPR